MMTAIILLTGGCSQSVSVEFSPRSGRRVFGEVRRLIDENHYLAGSGSPQWQVWTKAAEAASRRVAQARSWNDLYFQVLWPAVQSLGDTHTFVRPPRAADGEEGSAPRAGDRAAEAFAGGAGGGRWSGDLNSGLGFRLAARSGAGLSVYGITKGSPADVHEIQPGSIVLDYSLRSRGSEPPLFAGDLQSPDGTLRRLEFPLATAPAAPTFAASTLPSGITYVRFDLFDEAHVGRAIAALKQSPRPSVVDFRLNTGGDLTVMQHFLGALLGPGLEIGSLMSANKSVAFGTGAIAREIAQPLAVLVGPGTQSAAEVAAETLRHYGRAGVYGGVSAGQVLLSSGYALSDGGELRVATQNFISISGRRLEQRGTAPDEVVGETLQDIRMDRDRPLQVAEARLLATGHTSLS